AGGGTVGMASGGTASTASGDTARTIDRIGPGDQTIQKAKEAAVGLLSLVSLVAMITWIVTYDGPRGTQEVTCAVGICTVR
ncbi:hypothetical protein ACFOHP_19410, partial [Couchioplanes caeruleus subsp. azureus]